jgi:hypothetical protein
MDSIPSPSMKIQIIGGKVNKLFIYKSLLTTPSSGFFYTSSKLSRPYFEFSLKGEGDGIKTMLSFKLSSTLKFNN